MPSARWLHQLRQANAPAGRRLVFFPPAGSSASAAWPLTEGAPADWSVYGVQYPGRGPRLREAPAGSIRDMAAACLPDLLDDAGRTVLFGHSFGALVAYDVAHLLAGKGRPAAGLLVAGSSVPAVAVAGMPEEGLSDEELVAFLSHRGGTPSHLLADEELMRLTLPALRADLAIGRSYVDDHAGRLPTGIAAVGGQHDTAVTERQLRTWRELTGSWLGSHRVAGDHFSWLRDPVLMAGVLNRHWPA
ncbi:alpha/beta fold hydrolase [Actinocrispum sp. NPDC049592]|uniref:thioesterase II family protein n=1 Tax=Actinocrispum sp. NPDC049592 TaxID=3154835 RepID=UPI00341D3AB3